MKTLSTHILESFYSNDVTSYAIAMIVAGMNSKSASDVASEFDKIELHDIKTYDDAYRLTDTASHGNEKLHKALSQFALDSAKGHKILGIREYEKFANS